ncbi:hypothetical protein G7Y89_g3170 [Cudoniella acicularis]|uniref:Uncharacterized protein n=1 Tax=Cudoniella acicularis TaxID=354080 RepID=A0A8H4RRW0_9HELO|nr:hypothetical protein G7Y89_g3170 [Cudoniella acicularis]
MCRHYTFTFKYGHTKLKRIHNKTRNGKTTDYFPSCELNCPYIRCIESGKYLEKVPRFKLQLPPSQDTLNFAAHAAASANRMEDLCDEKGPTGELLRLGPDQCPYGNEADIEFLKKAADSIFISLVYEGPWNEMDFRAQPSVTIISCYEVVVLWKAELAVFREREREKRSLLAVIPLTWLGECETCSICLEPFGVESPGSDTEPVEVPCNLP